MEDIRRELNGDENHDRFVLEQYLPGWIVAVTDRYSPDYPHLQRNWEIICRELKVQPRKIVFVKEIIFDQEPNLINQVCEEMTRQGFIVRRASEFIACSNCQKAIPCEEIWNLLREKNFSVPNQWSERCSTC